MALRRWLSACMLLSGLACVLLTGCNLTGSGIGHHRNATAVPTGRAEPSATAAAGSASQQPEQRAPSSQTPHAVNGWREAARALDWERAYKLLAELPSERRAEPQIQLALGAAALHAGRHAEAVALLAKLEEKLPLVKQEILALYARAAAVAGPHDEAAAILLASPRVTDVLEAARAYLRAGKLQTARTAADRAVRLAEETRREQLDAHLLRSEIAALAGDKVTVVQDLRYVIGNHPERAEDPLAQLDRLGAPVSLEQRLTVLERSANQDNIAGALARFDELQKSQPLQAGAIVLGRAKALYRARDYLRAVAELDRAALLRPASAPEARYYAARAAERAGQPVAAAARFAALGKEQGRGAWAERACLRHAQMLLQLGRDHEAAAAFRRYLSRFKKQADESARHGLALALLGAGEAPRARELLQALRERASPADAGILQQLEGIAAHKSGDREAAVALWLRVVREQPLTWASQTALARLAAIGYARQPAVEDEALPAASSPLLPALPAAPALLSSLGLDAAAEKRLSAMERETAQLYPGRESEALCELYGQLAPARRRGQIGQRAASFKLLLRVPNDAELWRWSCVYPEAYTTMIERAEADSAVPRRLVHALIRQESVFEPGATSPAGARGLMQLMPHTAVRAAEELAIPYAPSDIARPELNVRLGAFYIGKLLRTFDGSVPLAVAAYNAGPHAVKSWLESGGERDVDLWVARIPYRETRNYVAAVLTNFTRYQWLAGRAAAVTAVKLELPKSAALGARDY